MAILVATVAALAGCASPAETATGGVTPPSTLPSGGGELAPETATGATSGNSGGSVANVAPTIQSFAGSASGADNSGTITEIFTLTLRDGNGEKDFRDDVVSIALTGAITGTFTHTVTLAESNSETDEPASFGADGFKVWTGAVKHDGLLLVKYRYNYAIGTPAGTYTFTPRITPDGGSAITGTAKSTTVEVFSELTIASAPVDANGNPTANNWGLWSATPGAANTEGTNLVKIVNTGQKADARVVIDFTESAFTSPDPDFPGIPLDNNIQFATCEVASSSTAPSTCSFTFGATSSSGSVAVQFSGLGKAIFVKYRVLEMPQVLPAGSYGASYTASEL